MSGYTDREKANRACKASRIRRKLREGKEVSQDQHDWLAEYDQEMSSGGAAPVRKALPPHPPTIQDVVGVEPGDSEQATGSPVPDTDEPDMRGSPGSIPTPPPIDLNAPPPGTDNQANGSTGPGSGSPGGGATNPDPKMLERMQLINFVADAWGAWFNATQSQIIKHGGVIALAPQATDHLLKPLVRSALDRHLPQETSVGEYDAYVIVGVSAASATYAGYLTHKASKKAEEDGRPPPPKPETPVAETPKPQAPPNGEKYGDMIY